MLINLILVLLLVGVVLAILPIDAKIRQIILILVVVLVVVVLLNGFGVYDLGRHRF